MEVTNATMIAGNARGNQRILELGCGTGEDALRLARRGLEVVAVDASPGMIQVARQKAQERDLGNRVEFHCLPMETLLQCLLGRGL